MGRGEGSPSSSQSRSGSSRHHEISVLFGPCTDRQAEEMMEIVSDAVDIDLFGAVVSMSRIDDIRDWERPRCGICGCAMKQAADSPTPWDNCGGDCLTCMAQAGDPHAIESMRRWLRSCKL